MYSKLPCRVPSGPAWHRPVQARRASPGIPPGGPGHARPGRPPRPPAAAVRAWAGRRRALPRRQHAGGL
eukprot:5433591-Pyramimonas_sp.AAC.1